MGSALSGGAAAGDDEEQPAQRRARPGAVARGTNPPPAPAPRAAPRAPVVEDDSDEDDAPFEALKSQLGRIALAPVRCSSQRAIQAMLVGQRKVLAARDNIGSDERLLLAMQKQTTADELGRIGTVLVLNFSPLQGHKGDSINYDQRCVRFYPVTLSELAASEGSILRSDVKVIKESVATIDTYPFAADVSRDKVRLNVKKEQKRLCGGDRVYDDIMGKWHEYHALFIKAIAAVKGEQVLVVGAGDDPKKLAKKLGKASRQSCQVIERGLYHPENYILARLGAEKVLSKGGVVAVLLKRKVRCDTLVWTEIVRHAGVRVTTETTVLLDAFDKNSEVYARLRRERSQARLGRPGASWGDAARAAQAEITRGQFSDPAARASHCDTMRTAFADREDPNGAYVARWGLPGAASSASRRAAHGEALTLSRGQTPRDKNDPRVARKQLVWVRARPWHDKKKKAISDIKPLKLRKDQVAVIKGLEPWVKYAVVNFKGKDKLDDATVKALSKHVPNKKPASPWPLPGGRQRPGRKRKRDPEPEPVLHRVVRLFGAPVRLFGAPMRFFGAPVAKLRRVLLGAPERPTGSGAGLLGLFEEESEDEEDAPPASSLDLSLLDEEEEDDDWG